MTKQRISKESVELGILKQMVPIFQASDGKEFANETECLEHQRALNFDEWYDADEDTAATCQLGSSDLDSESMRQWLTENQMAVMRLLGL